MKQTSRRGGGSGNSTTRPLVGREESATGGGGRSSRRHGHSHGHSRGSKATRDFCLTWGGFICVSFIWFFCFVSYISIWYFVFVPLSIWETTFGIFILFVFHVLVVLCLSTYARATRADPGYVDPSWVPPNLEEGLLYKDKESDDEEIGSRGDGLSCTPAVVDESSLSSSSSSSSTMIELSGQGSSSTLSSSLHSQKGHIDDNDGNTQNIGGGNQLHGGEHIDIFTDQTKVAGAGVGLDEEEEQRAADVEAANDKISKKKPKKKKIKGEFKEKNYCNKCGSYRPPRAHHCSRCKRCVLRMDHHCPWINNCVGHNNLKLFFLWLWYGTLLGGLFLLLFGYRIYDIYLHRENYTSDELWSMVVVMGVNLWIAIALTANLCGMGINIFVLILTNTTTIERMFGPSQFRRRRSKKKFRRKYDIGKLANLKQVLGESVWWWPLPTGPESDGYHSPVFTNPNGIYELW